MAAVTSSAANIWSVASRLATASTAGSEAIGLIVSTYVLVSSTVRCAHAVTVVIGRRIANSVTRVPTTIVRPTRREGGAAPADEGCTVSEDTPRWLFFQGPVSLTRLGGAAQPVGSTRQGAEQ